ncbi:unnamed protein product [Symbiodinium sp. CCMP2456]|nr:unnamed protein product [Symbiodinium sp. CCMP2456]
MNDYITRKTEAYMRASQALKRVQPHYEQDRQPPARPDHQRRASSDYSSWGWPRQWTPATQEDGEAPEADAPDGGDTEASTRDATNADEEDQWRYWRPYGGLTARNTWEGWSWGYEWPRSWDNHDWSSGYESSRASTTSSSASTELLPQFIQGWYLLADANLDAGERNIVMTALGGNFEPQRVAQELRNQFSESDVKKRDSQRRYQSYIGEYLENDEDDTEIYETGNHDYGAEGLSDEGHALVVDAEEAAQEAMSAMVNARRTLREARQRQHAAKQNRKYYQGNGNSGRGSSSSTTTPPKPRDDSGIECLRCGQRGHRVANCPHKPLSEQKGQAHLTEENPREPQQAPFVCYTDVHAGFATDHDEHYAMTAAPEDDGLTTAEAVRQGMAVIDGGAVMRQNRAKYGHSGLRGVDYKDPPVFSFGNSTENRCLSTARLITANGTAGEMRIHTLEDGESPILMSIETLRRVGAIIDFVSDLAVFRNLDPGRIVRLAFGKSGHQLLPLSEDLLGNSVPAQQSVPSLVNMDKMTCPQMVLSLRAYGEEPPKGWKKVQLLQRLKELEEQGEIAAPTTAKTKTPLELAVADLNRAGAKKSYLQKYVMEECGIKINGNETMHILTQRAMSHLLATVEPVGEEPMGFGKYANQSFQTVANNDPQYCSWALTTAAEGQCSQYLTRFATWMKMEKEKKKVAPKARAKVDLSQMMTKNKMGGYTTTGTEDPKPGTMKKEVSMATPTEGRSPRTSGAAASQATIEQLAMAVQTLANEVKTLKEEKGEKPRKIHAKPDQDMNYEEDGL